MALLIGGVAVAQPAAATPVAAAAATQQVEPLDVTVVEAYVSRVYGDLFGRDPDPVGLAHWVGTLQLGAPFSEVANGITYSAEFRAGLIRASYIRYLGREPDRAGSAGWLNAMGQGMHIEHMQTGFVASPEFYAQAGSTPEGWVRSVYRSVLEREAGESEVASWVEALDDGVGRGAVAYGILYSTEHLTNVVNLYYVHLLQRAIDPAGAGTWVTAIQRGSRDEEIVASIVSSREYLNNVIASLTGDPAEPGGPIPVVLGLPRFPSCVSADALSDKRYIDSILFPETTGVEYWVIGDGDGDGTPADAEYNWVAIEAIPEEGYVILDPRSRYYEPQPDGNARTLITYEVCLAS